ncbi:alpha/beta hydrolase [Microbacterium sp. NPDC012755]|uniref:alpha/beta hydrolase n=1 Tax=Microbacterium sp. NPDC012755 TaxID=3364184 RepID=UPI00369DD226
MSFSLKAVPSASAMDSLATDAAALGQRVSDTFDAVVTQWKLLDDAFVLIPAVPVSGMLITPQSSMSDFSDAMAAAKSALGNASFHDFGPLEVRRADLLGRIDNLNQRHANHQATLREEIAEFRADPANDPVITGRNHPETTAYGNAKANLSILDDEAETLALDVDRFHRDLDEAEAALATTLRSITGGDTVRRSDGSEVHSSQMYWGIVPPGRSQGFDSRREPLSLEDYFAQAVTSSVDTRIQWLADAAPKKVEAWLNDHPEFMETVGFVPPAAAAALFASLKARSTQDTSGAWTTGPLGTLWSNAPGAIGNLNGLKVSERSPFAEQELQRLLADPNLTGDQKTKLKLLDRKAAAAGVTLLSVFLDTDGDPRASLVWGDADTADQIITITHGIATDLGQLEDWGTIGDDLTEALLDQTGKRHLDSSTAVVLFMEWDSGDMVTVQGADRPQDGAAREVALIEGFRFVNPSAWQEGWAHSLGTTTTADAVLQSPGVFDHVTLFGSAGLTPGAGTNLDEQIASGDLTVSSTSADLDWIAMWGRVPGVSEHPVNPADLPGVDVFGSDGGPVDGYLGPGGDTGLPTQGHNEGASTNLLYRIHRVDPLSVATVGPIAGVLTMPGDSVGYLDPRSQSFTQAVADFMTRIEEHG